MVSLHANAKKAAKVIKATQCPKCHATVSRAADLSRHMKIHSPRRHEMMHRCSWQGCEYATLQKANLKTHINSKHTHDKKFACEVHDCPKTFNDPSAANRHRKRIHNMDNRAFRRYCKLRDSDPGYESDLCSPVSHPELDISELLAFDTPSESMNGPIDVSMDAFEPALIPAQDQTNTSSAPETYAPAQMPTIDQTSLAMFDALLSQECHPTPTAYCYDTCVPTPLTPGSAIIPMPEGYQSFTLTGSGYASNDYVDFQYSNPVYTAQTQSSSYGYQNDAFDYSGQSYAFPQPQQPQMDFSFDIPAPASTAMPEGNCYFDTQELEHYLTLEYLRQQHQQPQPDQWPIC